MNILVVEDRGTVSFYLAEALQAEGHVVLEAFNTNDAQAHWDNRGTTPIDCMIVDLQMPQDGLTEAEKKESRGGKLTGWLWLRSYVLPNAPAEYRSRVIIYTDYLRDLGEFARAGECQGIWLVPKRSPSNGAGEVLKRVREIGGMGR
jgi:CheY-like chemotaxis protein